MRLLLTLILSYPAHDLLIPSTPPPADLNKQANKRTNQPTNNEGINMFHFVQVIYRADR